jgi:predicted RNA-binding Zn-ribbon protein involved in translation (DUF1610 family)
MGGFISPFTRAVRSEEAQLRPMPEIISCPSCQRKLQVPESLMGQDVQCPTCGATFAASMEGSAAAAPAPKPPPPPGRAEPGRRPQREDYDDDYDYEEDDDRPRRRRRRDYLPHRGSTILTLGILSLIICGPILGPIAWIMGNQDLAEIRAGRMDPEGEGLTNAGRICGMIATILGIIGLVLFCIYLAFIGTVIGSLPRH